MTPPATAVRLMLMVAVLAAALFLLAGTFAWPAAPGP